jgi:hypothetical protein
LGTFSSNLSINVIVVFILMVSSANVVTSGTGLGKESVVFVEHREISDSHGWSQLDIRDSSRLDGWGVLANSFPLSNCLAPIFFDSLETSGNVLLRGRGVRLISMLRHWGTMGVITSLFAKIFKKYVHGMPSSIFFEVVRKIERYPLNSPPIELWSGWPAGQPRSHMSKSRWADMRRREIRLVKTNLNSVYPPQ